MESWLVDIKRVRIPRPKFGNGTRCKAYPTEPPKDYGYEDTRLEFRGQLQNPASLKKATEEIRRALEEKL